MHNRIPWEKIYSEYKLAGMTDADLFRRASETGRYEFFDVVRSAISVHKIKEAGREASEAKRFVEAD